MSFLVNEKLKFFENTIIGTTITTIGIEHIPTMTNNANTNNAAIVNTGHKSRRLKKFIVILLEYINKLKVVYYQRAYFISIWQRYLIKTI